ncbi:hypothetical protein RhiirA4_543584 [Rhizophagus irregularis]|uniref:Uncharacterized protein n=1 Tax=Rhizophagus irregularis TaxID=588596 RepID=A0A2I1GJM1_9GLOM|nr:hypothetical protein RhiirA4_543584 [Rhizophagus irregularis]
MSNKIRTRGSRGTPPYVQKIVLNSNNNRRVRRKPPKLCPDCKETSDCVKIFSSKNSERFQSLEDVEEAEGIEDLEYIEDGYLLFITLL